MVTQQKKKTETKKLIELGHLEDAKTLALKLMKDGTYQVECSDGSLMTSCWKPLIQAVQADVDSQGSQGAFEMLRADRVAFIRNREFKQLAKS